MTLREFVNREHLVCPAPPNSEGRVMVVMHNGELERLRHQLDLLSDYNGTLTAAQQKRGTKYEFEKECP